MRSFLRIWKQSKISLLASLISNSVILHYEIHFLFFQLLSKWKETKDITNANPKRTEIEVQLKEQNEKRKEEYLSLASHRTNVQTRLLLLLLLGYFCLWQILSVRQESYTLLKIYFLCFLHNINVILNTKYFRDIVILRQSLRFLSSSKL